MRSEPEKTKSSGLAMAFKEPKRNKSEKGRAMKGKQPSMKSDGLKTAMKGEGKPGDRSKLTNVAAAKKKVR